MADLTMSMKRLDRIVAIPFLLLALCPPLAACEPGESGGRLGDDEPGTSQLPPLRVTLPPPPSFEKEQAPERYSDGSFSIYGLRKSLKANLDKQHRVKAVLLEAYQCPPCPRGTKASECPRCDRPHLWLSDRASGPKDKGLMVTNIPKEDPQTKKKIEWITGIQYIFTGVFSRTSGTGFSASDGLLIYIGATPVTAE